MDIQLFPGSYECTTEFFDGPMKGKNESVQMSIDQNHSMTARNETYLAPATGHWTNDGGHLIFSFWTKTNIPVPQSTLTVLHEVQTLSEIGFTSQGQGFVDMPDGTPAFAVHTKTVCKKV